MKTRLSSGWKLHVGVCSLYILLTLLALPINFLSTGTFLLVGSSASILLTSLVLLAIAFSLSQSLFREIGKYIVIFVHTLNFFFGFLVAYPRLLLLFR